MKKRAYVKWYKFDEGFGFAKIEDEDVDVFIHFSQFKNTFLDLDEGDLIEFDLVVIQDRQKATNIRLV